MSAPAAPLVVCVVLNWNGAEDTIRCVQSLAKQDYPRLKVLVVDNASTDDSVARIRASLPGVEVLEAGSNRGFAAGCNVGIRVALARETGFVWLLNNDTIAPPETLRLLVAEAANPQIGLVGTVLRYMHDPATVQAWGGGRIVRWLGFSTHATSPMEFGPDSFLTFASVLIRRELLTSVGLLDEGYFMYFEDSDLCFRALDAGWKLAVAADTAVLHREGGSVTTGRNLRKERVVTASGLRFLGRHGRVPPVAMTLYGLSRVGKRLVKGDFAGVGAVLRGVGDWRRTSGLKEGS